MLLQKIALNKILTLTQQIKFHLKNKKYCRIKRGFNGNSFAYSSGCIVDKSDEFILMQESNEFKVLGYLIFPISTVVQIRYNNNDKYYDKIMRWENLSDKVSNMYNIDLTNWTNPIPNYKEDRFKCYD